MRRALAATLWPGPAAAAAAAAAEDEAEDAAHPAERALEHRLLHLDGDQAGHQAGQSVVDDRGEGRLESTHAYYYYHIISQQLK